MKKVICLLIIACIVSSMVACTANEGRVILDTTSNFVMSGQKLDVVVMDSMVIGEENPFTEQREEILSGIENFNNPDLESYVDSYMKLCAAKIRYKAKSIDKNTGKVVMNFKYLDGAQLLGTYVDECVNYMDANNKDELTQAEAIQIYRTTIQNSANDYLEKDVVVDFVREENYYKIKEVNDDLIMVLFSNMTKEGVNNNINGEMGNKIKINMENSVDDVTQKEIEDNIDKNIDDKTKEDINKNANDENRKNIKREYDEFQMTK